MAKITKASRQWNKFRKISYGLGHDRALMSKLYRQWKAYKEETKGKSGMTMEAFIRSRAGYGTSWTRRSGSKSNPSGLSKEQALLAGALLGACLRVNWKKIAYK